MWIKICGLTSAAAVATALELQVDALGFVFSASVRQLSCERALELAQVARGRARCVAVTRHPTQPLVDEILRVFAPDVLQSDLADLEALVVSGHYGCRDAIRHPAGAGHHGGHPTAQQGGDQAERLPTRAVVRATDVTAGQHHLRRQGRVGGDVVAVEQAVGEQHPGEQWVVRFVMTMGRNVQQAAGRDGVQHGTTSRRRAGQHPGVR